MTDRERSEEPPSKRVRMLDGDHEYSAPPAASHAAPTESETGKTLGSTSRGTIQSDTERTTLSNTALPMAANLKDTKSPAQDAAESRRSNQVKGKGGKGGGKGKARALKRNKGKAADREGGTLEEVMFYEAIELLGRPRVEELLAADDTDGYRDRFTKFEEVELEVVAISSHGT